MSSDTQSPDDGAVAVSTEQPDTGEENEDVSDVIAEVNDDPEVTEQKVAGDETDITTSVRTGEERSWRYGPGKAGLWCRNETRAMLSCFSSPPP